MSDPGNDEIEKLLKKLESRLTDEYRQATFEVREKLHDYLKRFRAKDAIKRQAVADGLITQADYIAWRQGQMMAGRRWQDMLHTLANDLTKCDMKARSIVYGYMPEAYSTNFNYTTFTIEQQGAVDTSFTLYSRETVERLVRDDPKLLPSPVPWGDLAKKLAEDKSLRWNMQKLNSAVLQGVLQGESIPKIAARVETVGAMDHKQAIRAARTAMTGAQNAGRIDAMRRAREKGVKLTKVWLATLDMRTRHEHRFLDGQRRDIDEPFEVDSYKIRFPGDPEAPGHLVYNCFVGDTNIATDSDIVRSYKSEYSGKLYEVETAGGVKFTCTPNHPILTRAGWVPVARLNNGDDIAITSIRDDPGLRRNGNIDHIHSRMKTLYNTLHCVGLMSRDSTLRVNFHGDVPATNVEVITKEWKLRNNIETGRRNRINKLLFINSNKPLMSKSAAMQHFWAIGQSALCLVCSFCKPLALFWRRMSHAIVHSIRTIAGGNTGVFQPKVNCVSSDVQFIGNRFDGTTGSVFFDNIININVTSVSHIDVFNLQTENGYYLVNSSITQNDNKCNGNFAIAHNCRCTLITQVKGFEYDIKGFDLRNDPNVEKMTYDEWKKSRKEKPNPITLPEDKAKAIRGAYINEYKRLARGQK